MRGERLAKDFLIGQLGSIVSRRRSSDQAADGGADVVIETESFVFVVECKWQERARMQSWMTQALDAAAKEEEARVAKGDSKMVIPIVMWKVNRGEWMWILAAEDGCSVLREACSSTQ